MIRVMMVMTDEPAGTSGRPGWRETDRLFLVEERGPDGSSLGWRVTTTQLKNGDTQEQIETGSARLPVFDRNRGAFELVREALNALSTRVGADIERKEAI